MNLPDEVIEKAYRTGHPSGPINGEVWAGIQDAAPVIVSYGYERGRQDARAEIRDFKEAAMRVRPLAYHEKTCGSGLAGDEGPCDCALADFDALSSLDTTGEKD